MKLNTILLRITDIKPYSFKLLWFVLPPLIVVYLYALLLLLYDKMGRKPSRFLFWFSLLLLFSLALSAWCMIEPPVFLSDTLSAQLLLCFIAGLGLLFFMLLVHATILSVNYEREKNAEQFYHFTDLDYLGRFFTLCFLPLTIWLFHAKVQEYKRVEEDF